MHEAVPQTLDSVSKYGSAGPFIVVVLVLAVVLLVAGWGFLRYLAIRDKSYQETMASRDTQYQATIKDICAEFRQEMHENGKVVREVMSACGFVQASRR